MVQREILDYYLRGGERDRLSAGAGRLEFLRTWDVLVRALPEAPADVLDVGGATGVYAKPLAEAGYRVTVVDPVGEHVAVAGALPGVSAVRGDARDLPAEDASADAVLLFGPLYHLQDRSERVAAWREAARVVRPGGLVVAATISRFASMFDGFVKGFYRDPEFRPVVEQALADGRHSNPGGVPRWFTSAYFHRPEETAGEVADAGLRLSRVVSVEGPLWMSSSALADFLDEPSLLLEMLRRVEEEPSLLGASSHLLTVAVR
ncbi:methyltransferase domain-containing protein [Actinoplanes sp. LDG1-06]|uniref:Methyltransferase domain-containing protein n=1 Tax=Paractinoplanes ovalisporus TaxID=2810368 RepID=A0ABS2A8H2_9ACTN|nr:class I SAM-dependent methyltransferase [Actinoplanes ovalisporus]MBM2616127.1 methyltransferase domain-containing protein [Actinoplanes ovalisporus]